MARNILDRLPRGTERRSRYNTQKQERRSTRRSGTYCSSTTNDPEVGYVECDMRDGHRGIHRSSDGITWTDEYAIN